MSAPSVDVRLARIRPLAAPLRTATVIVLAKAPRPGRVKTRLQSRYSPEQAALLAQAALQDTLAAVTAFGPQRSVLALDGPPPPWLDSSFEVDPQVCGDLSERIAAALDHALPGPGPALLVGMDTPQLRPEHLDVDWADCDAVLGMSRDGGYWAIGLRAPHPGAVRGVPMSQPDTGVAQLRRLESLALRVRLLPELRDVDNPADADAVAAAAPATRFSRLHARLDVPVSALELYDEALGGADVHAEGGHALNWQVSRWQGEPDAVDLQVLDRCEGPVLDIGCGPGRLVAELARRGRPALGIDVSKQALIQASARGGSVLRRGVHADVPGAGRWGTALLLDGNIGIGGDPDRLLRRCRELLRSSGLLLVEADRAWDQDDRSPVVLSAADGRRAAPLPWARLGRTALARRAEAHGFRVADSWVGEGRVFLALRSR